MENFILGAIAMGYGVAGLFFLRYWRDARDRLFIIFALAFFILAANRLLFSIIGIGSESVGSLYVVRLFAFSLILAAIIDKNIGSIPGSSGAAQSNPGLR